MATKGNFVKCNFTDVRLSTTRLASNVSNMFPLCFSDMFYPIQNIFCHILKKYDCRNKFWHFADSALVNSSTSLQQNQYRLSSSGCFILGSKGTSFETKILCRPSCFLRWPPDTVLKLVHALSPDSTFTDCL